jgi:hypothetical protein
MKIRNEKACVAIRHKTNFTYYVYLGDNGVVEVLAGQNVWVSSTGRLSMHMMVHLVVDLLDAHSPSEKEVTGDHIVQAEDATELVE